MFKLHKSAKVYRGICRAECLGTGLYQALSITERRQLGLVYYVCHKFRLANVCHQSWQRTDQKGSWQAWTNTWKSCWMSYGPVQSVCCWQVRMPKHNISKFSALFIANAKSSLYCSRSSENDTKRWGMLYLVNQLLKIYFRINKLHLCKALIRAIDASQFKDQFSLSQQVTYRYYVGRKAIFESDFKSGRLVIYSENSSPNYKIS